MNFALGALAVLVACAANTQRPAHAQDLEFEHITTADGLAENSVFAAVLQDYQGYIWIGTQNGLHRYDGYTLDEVYQPDPADSASVSGGSVAVIHEAADSSLWIGFTRGGLSRFDRKTRSFKTYTDVTNGAHGLPSNSVGALMTDKDGVLWIGSGYKSIDSDVGALSRFIPASNTFEHFSAIGAFGAVTDLVQDADGFIWVGTSRRGLQRFDPATRRFDVPPAVHEAGLDRGFVADIYLDKDQTLFAGFFPTNRLPVSDRIGGVCKLGPTASRFLCYRHDPANPRSLSDDRVRSVLRDRDGILWVGTYDAVLNRMDNGSSSFTHHRYNPSDRHGFDGGRAVVSLYEDRRGTLWIGTWLGGLNKLDKQRSKFVRHIYRPGKEGALQSRQVMSIFVDSRGQTWVGTGTFDGADAALYRYDEHRNIVERFSHEDDGPKKLPLGAISDIVEDRQGNIWLISFGNGISKFDRARRTFRHYTNNPDDDGSLAYNVIRDLLVDSQGTLWVATFGGGLDRYDPSADAFVHHVHDPDDEFSIPDNQVSHLYEADDGEFWVSTNLAGLTRFDRETRSFKRFPIIDTDDGAYHTTLSIKKDRKGRLWLGTLTGGLIQFDAGTGVSVNQYEVGDGLSHDTVWSIQIDDDGRLWLGTHNGLTRFDPDANTFRVYEESDGLPSNQIVWEAASHQTAEGEMLFGGIDGFVSFFPDQVIDNPDSPPVLLKSFEPVAGVHEPRPRWLDDTNEVTVRYGDRSFSIDFVALNYRVSEKNLYRYRLAPLEAAWREASTSRRASYVNVPPGRYTFLVQGSNNDGVWNEEGDQVRITVVPPWWRAWWAYVGYFLLGTAVLAGVDRVRRRQAVRVERMRLRIASRLHDDIGANLSSIALKSDLARNETGPAGSTPIALATIGETARETALALREVVWIVNAGYDSLPQLVLKMEDLTDAMLAGQVGYTFERPPSVPDQRMTMEVRQNIYYIYKEALHNVLKHAHPQHVAIDVGVTADRLSVTIADDGIGFSPEESRESIGPAGPGNKGARKKKESANKTSGFGLSSMRERAQTIGATLRVDSTPGMGTHIGLAVPLR